MRRAFGALPAKIRGKVFYGGVEGGMSVFAGEKREKIGAQGFEIVAHCVSPFRKEAPAVGRAKVACNFQALTWDCNAEWKIKSEEPGLPLHRQERSIVLFDRKSPPFLQKPQKGWGTLKVIVGRR